MERHFRASVDPYCATLVRLNQKAQKLSKFMGLRGLQMLLLRYIRMPLFRALKYEVCMKIGPIQ